MEDVDDDSKSHKVFDLTVRQPLVQYESFDCTRAGTVYMCTLGSSVHRETMKTPTPNANHSNTLLLILLLSTLNLGRTTELLCSVLTFLPYKTILAFVI